MQKLRYDRKLNIIHIRSLDSHVILHVSKEKDFHVSKEKYWNGAEKISSRYLWIFWEFKNYHVYDHKIVITIKYVSVLKSDLGMKNHIRTLMLFGLLMKTNRQKVMRIEYRRAPLPIEQQRSILTFSEGKFNRLRN